MSWHRLALTAFRAGAGLLSAALGCEIYAGRSIDLFADTGFALECTRPMECPRERALCARGGCVECVSSADCRGPRPLCDAGRCVACTSAADCTTAESCNTALGVCARRCTEPSECAGQVAVVCSDELSLCVECASDADCSEPRKPACDGGGRCVECTAASHCPSDRPACSASAQRCVECASDADCESGVCDRRDNRCVECRSDEHCPGGSCDVGSRTCRYPCAGPDDCDPRRPLCDGDSGSCVECFAGADCADPKKPACGPELRCAECAGDADCSMPGKPACVAATGKCAECTRPEHCPEGLSCDLASARCAAPPPAAP